MTINGGGFTGATAVVFNGTAGTFTVNSDTQITATVPAGATSGPISVTTPSGSVSSGSGSPMAFVGSAVASRTSGATSLPLTIPSGYQAGDLLVAWMSFPDNISGLSGMSGWTEFSWSPLVDGTTWNVHCFYKIATASEQPPTISWTTKSKPVVEISDWRGVNQSSPFVASGGVVDSSSSKNVVGPALTNAAAGAWAVAMFSIRTSYSADKSTSYASIVPGGLTKRVDANTGAASSAPWAAAATADSNGAVGTGSHQYTGDTTATTATSHKAAALLYLAPGGGGSFTVTPSPPSISGFTPASGPVGTTVTINGSGFSGATAVAFNGASASYTVNSASQITATVPNNAGTGPITVTTPNGTATSSTNYTVTVAAPSISGFTPASGPVGTTVTINGSGFSGATAVAFNGASASYTVNSASQITATVPNNAGTGPITVTTPNGTATSSTNYTVTVAAPSISGFTPASGPVGTTVTINGSGFSGATAVAFNGASASYTVNSASQITATVPNNAGTGPITVTTPNGTATSSTNYTVTVAAPSISGFTPASGPVGTTVTINGSGFSGATAVAFNGASASYTVNSASQITATVPNNAGTGPITVTTPNGTATSSTNYTVTVAAPSISGFTPASGPVGTTVTINGSGFSGATAVAFNGASASYTVNSASQITATVPNNAGTGPITVTTPNGTATSSTNYTVTVAAPSISGFTPASGPVGTTVTINGSGFSGATAVAFNGASASYTVNSASQITATVPNNAGTGPITVTTPNGTATSSTNYTVTTSSAPYQVYVGYYDTHHPNNPQPKPSPWMLSPNVDFIGTNDEGNKTTLGNWDTSAVRVDNLTSGPLTVHVTVDIPVVYPGSSTSNDHFDLWGTQAIPAGASLILAQTAYENFDGSDYNSRAGQYGQDPLLCTNPLDISSGIPVVHVTLGTTTTDYLDTGQILNTKGVDGAGCRPPVASPTRDDESTGWTPLG